MAENMKKREARIQKAGGVIGGVIGIASIVFAMAVVYVSRVLDLHGIYGWPQGCTMGMLPFTGWLAGDAVFTLRQVKKL